MTTAKQMLRNSNSSSRGLLDFILGSILFNFVVYTSVAQILLGSVLL